jgi:hypothetical protein
MRHRPSRPVALVLAGVTGLGGLVLAGCGGGGGGETARSGTGEASATTTAASASTGSFDPRADELCELFTDAELSAALGSAPDLPTPGSSAGEAECNWSSVDGPSLTVTVALDDPGEVVYDDVTQYLEVTEGSESLDLGSVAIIKSVPDSSGETVSIDAVVNGWYISVQGFGVDGSDGLVELARVLESSLVAFTAGPGSTVTTAGSGGSSSGATGALEHITVTIDGPADIAGTTTTESIDATGFASFTSCSKGGGAVFDVSFRVGAPGVPPTPLGAFGITADQGVAAGSTAPVRITYVKGISDEGTPQELTGTVTVAADGTSGTFAAGTLTGSYTCRFAS